MNTLKRLYLILRDDGVQTCKTLEEVARTIADLKDITNTNVIEIPEQYIIPTYKGEIRFNPVPQKVIWKKAYEMERKMRRAEMGEG